MDCTPLPAIPGMIRVPVIKYIPFSCNLNDTAVVVCPVCHRHILRLFICNADVAVADHTTILKSMPWITACGITQLMHHNGRINKVVQLPLLPDGGRFKKFMSLKTASFPIWMAWNNKYRYTDRFSLFVLHIPIKFIRSFRSVRDRNGYNT